MAGTITTIVRALFQSQGADKVVSDINKVGKAGEESAKKQTRLGNESTNTGRAFSSQASGLGGLVAAYAGAAATTFALQQAFAALKSAADFQQIISGTNALAASFGQSGSQILNSIQDITKGQLSLKEASAAANLALSAGFNPQQINSLSEVATKASRTLGRDLTDSYNRLVRGAAKLEPELLDELGIFTRIEPAIEAYASKTGKAASSLTNFERRQAFVNAIIDEGSRKYSEISLSTDTSSEALNRLAARIVDVGNKLGSILTDFLAPIANFFGKDLGNSVLIFLGILTLALGKGRTLLEAFFTDLSTRALETGARVSSALTGPAFTTNIEKAGEALKGIGVGLTKAEAATIRSIKEGTVQPQQIQARIDELKALQERQQVRQQQGLQGKALDQSTAKVNAATIAIRELEEAQKKASSSSVIAGTTFEKLGGGLSRFATGISTALGYFNLFLAGLGAAQLIGQVFGVDLLGSITNFFTNLQERSRAADEATNNLITTLSKDSLTKFNFKFRFNKQDVEDAGKAVATTVNDILRDVENRPRITIESQLQKALAIAQGSFTFTESGARQKEVRIQLLKDLINAKPSPELLKILTTAPAEVGGQGGDYLRLFTSGELEKGALKFAGVTTNILDTNKEIDKYTGKTALNVGLGIVEVQKFYEEQAKGLLTAESASQRNIALSERIKQIDTEIIEARIRGAKETSSRVRGTIEIEALRLNIQKNGLIVKQKEINLISEELAQRERIRKSIQTTFSSQIKFIENLPTSGLFNPDKTISRSQEETQRNQVLFLGQQASSLEESLKLQIDSLNVATENREEVENTLRKKSQQLLIDGANQNNLEEIARIQAALTKATQAENIETSKLTDINVRLKEVLQAQLGIMYEAGKQAYQLAIQEEKRTLEYQKQLDSLKNQGEQLEIQNKINRAQAAAEANQRRGQSQIKLLESEINYLKEIENLVESVSKAQLADLEIRKNQVDRAQQLRDADRELAKARTERQFTGALAVPTLQKEILGRSQNLVLEEDLIRLDKQIADINYARELALIEDRKAIADQEFSVTKERLKVQEEEIQTQLATLEGRKVLQNQQQVIEDNIIKKREKLDRDKIQNEISVLALQSDLARARARGELDVAADAKLRRDFELDLISKQLFLLEQQKEVFKQFLTKYEELINKQQGTTGGTTANDIFKNFETDLTKARTALIKNQQLSEQIFNQESRNILLRSAGEIDVNNIRAAGARAELDNLIKTQEQEAQTRDQIRMAQELNRETEVKLLQDKLKGLETEAALAKKRYDTAIVSAATDEIKAAQVYASELQRIADQRNKVKQLFEDISRGIKENLSTAVLDFFKAINQGIPTIQAFREGMQKLAISVAETIQTAILKKFLIEPLQNLVGGAIGSLYTAITGDQLAKTGDQILQSVFTGNALRVTMVGAGGTTSGGATPDQASGPVTPGVIKPPTEEAQGFGDKLKELGVNFQTVGTVAATTFAATLAATRDWKKAFIYTVVSALGTALTQIATKQLFSGAVGTIGSGMTGAGVGGFFSSIGNWFSGLNATPTGVGNIAPGVIGTGTAIGGPVKHMAAGGYAGLRDRVPALLEPGEFVIRRPAAMAIGGQTLNQMNATGQTAPGNVMVNVNNQGTSQEVVGTPKVSVNGRDMIVDIVVRDIQNNGPIRKTLRGM